MKDDTDDVVIYSVDDIFRLWTEGLTFIDGVAV